MEYKHRNNISSSLPCFFGENYVTVPTHNQGEGAVEGFEYQNVEIIQGHQILCHSIPSCIKSSLFFWKYQRKWAADQKEKS